MFQTIMESYTDREIVDGILHNDKRIIEYFFFKKCSSILKYIAYSVFDGNIDTSELISELYLYLADKNWHKVRQFDFRSKLLTWVSVVAIRFFQKKREILIEKESRDALNTKTEIKMTTPASLERKMDVCNALARLPNERYKMVITQLDLNDIQPEALANQMQVSVENLYNIHRRALLQLKVVMSRKEDYYD